MYGFMGKILRVDLKEKRLWDESIDEEFARKYIGGVGFATKILYDEVPKGADPLGPENKLIFMTGPLTGTTSPSAAVAWPPTVMFMVPIPRIYI